MELKLINPTQRTRKLLAFTSGLPTTRDLELCLAVISVLQKAEGAGSRSRMFSSNAAALGSCARAKRADPLVLSATVPLIVVHRRHKRFALAVPPDK
jgi:hypothetical protein